MPATQAPRSSAIDHVRAQLARRWNRRPIAIASTSQIAINAMLTIANCRGAKLSQVLPANTRPADRTSPNRTKNVALACLALYLASRLVGQYSALRVVFCSE